MDMEINFPNLGIYLDHVGKNISIFGFSIAYYGIVIVTGMMIAIWIAQREAKRTGQNPEQYLDLAMIGIAAGILGARIYYVIFAWDYYKDDLLSIFNIRQGGLAIYGGIIGACIAVVIYSRKKKQNFSLLMDTASMSIVFGQIMGRWGNFFNSCGKCVKACSMNLLPTELEHAFDMRDARRLEKLKVNLCVNCGACSFVCPAKRNLAEKNQLAKAFLREQSTRKGK